MNREAYRLANEIRTELEADRDCLIESLTDTDMKKYQTAISGEIKKEKRAARKAFHGMAIAACAAIAILATTAVFSEEVHAAIQQISWTISNALGISSDLADYREVVNTSVSDNGYIITLQEAVASEEKLIVNYTVQKEIGQPLEEMFAVDGELRINGKRVSPGSSGSAAFLDEEGTILGVVASYDVPDTDLSLENNFQISINGLGIEEQIKGNWEFAFTASGSDLIANTKRTAIEKDFELPDGTKVTLEEYTSNDLEQRITFRQSRGTNYMLMVNAVDSEGNQVEFGLRSADAKSGYLQNEEILYDSRVDDNAKSVTMTLYAVALPEEDGRIPDNYEQIGEPFELIF